MKHERRISATLPHAPQQTAALRVCTLFARTSYASRTCVRFAYLACCLRAGGAANACRRGSPVRPLPCQTADPAPPAAGVVVCVRAGVRSEREDR